MNEGGASSPDCFSRCSSIFKRGQAAGSEHAHEGLSISRQPFLSAALCRAGSESGRGREGCPPQGGLACNGGVSRCLACRNPHGFRISFRTPPASSKLYEAASAALNGTEGCPQIEKKGKLMLSFQG